MDTLYIFKHNSIDKLNGLVQLLGENSAVIVIENGAYLLNSLIAATIRYNCNLYLLKQDASITNFESKDVDIVDYSGFVNLTCKYSKVITW